VIDIAPYSRRGERGGKRGYIEGERVEREERERDPQRKNIR
jgi:hypothetical protein